jgi:peptidoglycan hydrolase-like protein with peptidoglycan-binding domain
MEVEKYFDPRGKTFTDDVEMMHENINRIRSGARGSSSKPSPISYMDIRGRDDMPSNFRGTVISGGGGSDMGTKTGGESAKGRLTSTGGIAETQELIDRGLLDDNFIKDAVSDMTEQERAIMFSRNLRLGPDNFKVVYEALEGDKEPDRIQDYILYATEFEAQGARNPEDAPIIRQQSIRNVKKLVDAGVLPKKFAVSPEAPAAEMPEAPAAAEMPEAPAAEAPKAPATDARGSNLLAMGSRGAGVQKIQEDLTALNQFENLLSGKMPEAQGPFDPGVSGVDGVFGQDTQAAVKAFQKRAGIADDGIVGPDTRDALKKALDASKSAVKLQRSQAEEIKSMPSPAEPPAFGAGLQRVDEGPLEAAASEFEDITEIEPVKSDRDAPIQNTQAYEDLELDEEPRRTAFPMARDFRRRRNRR